MRTDGLRHVLLVLLLVGVVVLVLCLAWHLVGMDHATDASVLGACVAILSAALAALSTASAAGPRWVAATAGTRAAPVPTAPPVRRPRSPPREGTVLRR